MPEYRIPNTGIFTPVFCTSGAGGEHADFPTRLPRALSFYLISAVKVHTLQLCFLVPALALAVLTGCARTPPAAADAPNGKTLYVNYCVSCHGANGRNDRDGAVPAMRLAGADTLSQEEWNHLVLAGRGQMPAFRNRLSLPQLRALHDYVRVLITD